MDYFNPDFGYRDPGFEQNGPFRRLISVKMKVNRKKSLPALANGQVWKTGNAYIQIVELGKRLIDYRMMRELGQARRTQTSSIETMEHYLKTNEARLVKGNSRN
jgi:heterodisulfide reductase subunit C